jgi:flagellin
MVIGTNMSALNDALLLQQSSQLLSQSLNRLSSGSQIISPADDAAGLGETMRLGGEQLRNQAASNNLSDALSFQQTQDGYLQNITNALDRMSELAVQAQDVTKSDSDRALYNQEYQTLATYVSSVQSADFNGVSLFSGNALNVTDDQSGHTFALAGISATYLSGETSAGDVNTVSDATSALSNIETAINSVASDRANIGAGMQRIEYNISQLGTLNNNLAAASSRISDVDVAEESTVYARENILVQTGTAMLAQANSQPESVLRLLS